MSVLAVVRLYYVSNGQSDAHSKRNDCMQHDKTGCRHKYDFSFHNDDDDADKDDDDVVVAVQCFALDSCSIQFSVFSRVSTYYYYYYCWILLTFSIWLPTSNTSHSRSRIFPHDFCCFVFLFAFQHPHQREAC